MRRPADYVEQDDMTSRSHRAGNDDTDTTQGFDQADAIDADDDGASFNGFGTGDDVGTGPVDYDGDQFDRDERSALRRIAGLSTELTDVTEVEYRQLRLERVVLVGVWTDGTAADAEYSLKELAALAETA